MFIHDRAWRSRAGIAAFTCAALLSLGSFAVREIETGEWLWVWPEHSLSLIQPELGLAYVARTNRLDLSSHEQPSRAVIAEDGRALGPANSQHADIRTLGGGRFSFWHDYVYFSASDGSDPRTNGRRYSFRTPPLSAQTARVIYGVTLLIDIVATVILLAVGLAPLTSLVKRVAGRLMAAPSARLSAAVGWLRTAPPGIRSRLVGFSVRPGSHDYSTTEVANAASGLADTVTLRRTLSTRVQRLPERALLGITGISLISLAAGVGGAFIAALIVATAIDPVPILTWTSSSVAAGVAIALVFAAGYVLALAVTPQPVEGGKRHLRLVLQSVVWLAVAAFAWFRPGVGDIAQFDAEVRASVGWLGAGVVACFLTPQRIRARVARWRQQRSWSAGAVATGASLLVVLPSLLVPVAQYWDSSGFMDSHSYDVYAINIVTGKRVGGSSDYMPLYQYGLASVYYLWGHFFFVQQIVNVVLTVAGIACLCLAGWVLFRSAAAVVAIGLLAGLSQPFQYAIFFTQIESWYLPLVCALLLAWAHFWRGGTWKAAVALGVAISVGMNIRNQGAPFFAFMCLAPLMIPGVRWPRRIAQVLVIGAIVGASLVPWTIRNYVIDGRFSPSASRSTLYVGVLNDHRIGLYGIRNWEGWNEVAAEFERRYPDPAEREQALVRAMWDNVTSDPAWTVRAMFWRSASFYGLLPNGYTAIDRIVPTDWATEWQGYVYWRMAPIVILPLSLLGLAFRPGRTTLFLAGAVLANLSINLVSAASEDRVSYPVLPLHLLMMGAIFTARRELPGISLRPARAVGRARIAVPATIGLAIFLLSSRVLVGEPNTYRPQMESAVTIAPALEVDPAVPTLSGSAGPVTATLETLEPGRRVRTHGMLTNYMYPPKFAGAVGWIPSFATDLHGPVFYYLTGLTPEGTAAAGSPVGITLRGARISEPLREGDAVEVEAEVLHDDRKGPSGLWLRALLVKKLPLSPEVLPPFQ